ncbi:MAG: CheA signal transduction histidine kinase [Planctomycetaceae bacterium]|nr:CheA signal transduction histidine kinase [Planctomycetaceae bacterium]
MPTATETSAIDRLMLDAREVFSAFREIYHSDRFVADPDNDLEWLRGESTLLRARATETGLNVFAEIMRCLEASLTGLIANNCELSDSLIILIKVAEDALHGHETGDLNAPALVARASVEYRRMRNLPKNGDSRAAKKMLKRLETPTEGAKEEQFTVSRDDLLAMLEAHTQPVQSAPQEMQSSVERPLFEGGPAVSQTKPSGDALTTPAINIRPGETTEQLGLNVAVVGSYVSGMTKSLPISITKTAKKTDDTTHPDDATASPVFVNPREAETLRHTETVADYAQLDSTADLDLDLDLIERAFRASGQSDQNSEFDAADADEEKSLRAVFIEEVADHCRQINEILARVSGKPEDASDLEDARRRIHSIKGSAGVMGWQAVARLSHRSEDLLERLLSGSFPVPEQGFDLLQCCLDVLGELLTDAPCDELLQLIHERFVELGLDDSQGGAGQQTALAPAFAADQSVISGESKTHATPATTMLIDPAQIELDNIEEISAEMREIFMEEAEDHLRIIYAAFARVETEGPTSALVRDIRRSAHTLKGAAGAVGFRVVGQWAHRMEDILDKLEETEERASAETISLLYRTTDAIQDLIHGQYEPHLIQQRLARLLTDYHRHQTNEAGATPSDSMSFDRTLEQVTKQRDNRKLPPVDPSQIELDQVAEISPEMREIFMEEAEDHLRIIYAAFSRVETEGATSALAREIRRSVHTLKGAAGAVGFRVAGQWAHRMEDILDRLEETEEHASADTISLLYRTTDAIQDLVHGQCEPDSLRHRLAQLLTCYQDRQDIEDSARSATSNAISAMPLAESAPVSKHKEIKVDVDLIDFEAIENSARAALARSAVPKRSKATISKQLLRVPIERLDALARTVSELVINRTAFEQRMVDLLRFVEDNRSSVQRLRGISYKLETEFGVKLLGGHRGFAQAAAASGLYRGQKTTEESRPVEEFDSLEFDRYSDFHILARSLAETTSDFDTVGNELRGLLGDFDTLLNRQGRLAREAQNRIMGIRMVPLSTLSSRLQRAVRVVAQEQAKDVVLELMGETVELDKLVLEEISDPLLHLLRNAVDHGIESTEQRQAAGKPTQATIRIHAYHQGTQIVLQIQDDGQGLDYEKIRRTAVLKGIISESEADCSTEEDLGQLIYLPGFSTASQVTEISGRGVGMDVVRDKVQKLKGTIDIGSEPGKGTSFTIRLPMTMAITRALLISANQETFALPIQVVQQILRIEKSELKDLDQDSVIRIKDRVYPVIRLSERLNLRQRGDSAIEMVPTLLVSAGGRTVAIIVDRILSSRDIVVKTLGNHLQYVPGLIGATLMGDGSVIPILDPIDLVGVRTGRVRTAPINDAAPADSQNQDALDNASAEIDSVDTTTTEPTPVDLTLKVMIVDDSVSVRRVMSNVVRNAGMIPIVAKDGVDALEMLQSAENEPHIFLLDIEMPRMDGFELLSTLRGQKQHRESPIVMITSRAGEKHRKKAAELGASEYLTKPFRDQELLETIRRLTHQEAVAMS